MARRKGRLALGVLITVEGRFATTTAGAKSLLARSIYPRHFPRLTCSDAVAGNYLLGRPAVAEAEIVQMSGAATFDPDHPLDGLSLGPGSAGEVVAPPQEPAERVHVSVQEAVPLPQPAQVHDLG